MRLADINELKIRSGLHHLLQFPDGHFFHVHGSEGAKLASGGQVVKPGVHICHLYKSVARPTFSPSASVGAGPARTQP
jgi:hypothetical protein